MDNVTKIFRLNSNFGILNKLVTALEVPLTVTCQGEGLRCWSFCPLCLLSWELLAAEGSYQMQVWDDSRLRDEDFFVTPLYLFTSSLQTQSNWRTQCFPLIDWSLTFFFTIIFSAFFSCFLEKWFTFNVLGHFSRICISVWNKYVV